MLAEQAELENERKARHYRYENRRSLDELLRKILNGDLFELFCDVRNFAFEEIPLRFASHSDYLNCWEFNFSYEVYSLLMNTRRSDGKDERPT
jgi:hypothetical protein